MTTHSPAYDRFIASMQLDYMKWHDGEPYDLDALEAMTEAERAEVEGLLIGRRNEDWRDAEALARLSTPRAIEALEQSRRGPNREVRLRASELLDVLGRLDSFEAAIVEGLRDGALGEGLAKAERLAAEHPSAAVERELLRGALCAKDGRGVRFAALLFFLHGKASEPFDWSQRPFFLRFNTQDPAERRVAFDELCAMIGVDGGEIDAAP